ncbi:universal stress protein [Paraburkholderia diazotrophica]|uniref:Nucleotide-binding universal stress protein, UspA family n=1 Tax=Paraburkholderia diazotrophica TaxID=667676 RepID=A0A1H6Y0B1_9BURK|nr:universal stress protein [Paraburkholderia diazotrophica]SEJ34738.1 Nucleotide-binding universal stress protein, UspA family [Paraburkholderia diazotrophica]
MYQRILVAIDGSPSAERALGEAVKLAQLSNGTIEALCVLDRGKWPAEANPLNAEPAPAGLANDAAAAALAVAERMFEEAGVRGSVRAIDAYAENVSAVLARVADECEADLIVMGTHGRRGVQRFLLGSVAESLVRSTDIPVLIVRHDSSEQSPSQT